MNSRLKFRFISAIFVFLVSVGCATFRVDSPKPSDPLAAINGWCCFGPQKFIVIQVVFNAAVDRSTVIAGRTVFLKTTKDPNAAFNIAWNDDRRFTLTTIKVSEDLLFPHPDDGFTLTLIGTDAGQGVIRDTSGKALDGDYNGTPGGDYKIVFTLIG